MLKALRTAALLLAFTCAAHAGEVLTPPAVPVPSPQAAEGATTEGEILTPPLVSVVLTLLSLF